MANEKSQLIVETLKAILIIKCNYNLKFLHLKAQKEIVKKICSAEKYLIIIF